MFATSELEQWSALQMSLVFALRPPPSIISKTDSARLYNNVSPKCSFKDASALSGECQFCKVESTLMDVTEWSELWNLRSYYMAEKIRLVKTREFKNSPSGYKLNTITLKVYNRGSDGLLSAKTHCKTLLLGYIKKMACNYRTCESSFSGENWLWTCWLFMDTFVSTTLHKNNTELPIKWRLWQVTSATTIFFTTIWRSIKAADLLLKSKNDKSCKNDMLFMSKNTAS